MSQKKRDKRLAHAQMIWEREQLQAAQASQAIDQALEIMMKFKDELTEEQIEEALDQTRIKKAEIEKFILKARDKFATKLDDLNLEAVIHDRMDRSNAVLVNLEDL